MVNAPGNEKRFYAVDPEFDPERAPVKFRLTYDGRLESNGGALHKHSIRRALHPQLKRLWQVEPNLSTTASTFMNVLMAEGAAPESPWLTPEGLAKNFQRDGFRYVPLVNKAAELVASLDILYLRYGMPGNVLVGGDIDNRLKTLFDALTMPGSKQQIGDAMPGPDEDPFYVLLEDDRLINQVSVETDTLLDPPKVTDNKGDWNSARLVITVHIRPTRVTMDNMHFV